MFVTGTAGHVDHGKSTLIRALTGSDPDRLREEQERHMTIDLGFAWLTLPSGREVSIVDVPGHEDFIKNMLAGVGGIDVALFVVAADESVMPQTREHLAILDLLQVPRGVVALTKSDLIEDPEWLDLVQEEVREELAGTVLESAAIVPVSALTGSGLPELLAELDRLLDSAEPRRDMGRPRLPIDRIFTITGFGTVVTGTLTDGRLRVGDEVEIVPGGLTARIRGLQTHKTKVTEAEPGSRVAVNLVGVTIDDLRRGQVVTRPGALRATTLLDARLRVLPSAPVTLKHNASVEFFCGADRSEAHLRLLDAEGLPPGSEGWVQVRLVDPIALAHGDHFIVRLASPSVTLGGGVVVQPNPGRRYRRFRSEVIDRLQALLRGTPEELLFQILSREGPLEARSLFSKSGLPLADAAPALRALVQGGRVVSLRDLPENDAALNQSGIGLVARDTWARLINTASVALEAYHRRYPLRAGMPREELKSRTGLQGALYGAWVERATQEGVLQATATTIALAQHRVTLSPEQESAIGRAMAMFRDAPYTPPSQSQVEPLLGAELLQHLVETGRLVRVGDGVLFEADVYAAIEQRVAEHLRTNGSITVAQVRDLFNTSRKYALALLEDLDSRRITRRVGDERVLR